MGKMLNVKWKRMVAFILVIAFMACSMTFLANIFTEPQTYSGTIESIDEKKATVLGVSAAIAATATALAVFPEDATTPLAEELMDVSSLLVAVVCALVLEKSLLTIFGALSCYVLIPIACILGLIYIVNSKQSLLIWVIKFGVFALALLAVVPGAMKLSDYIYEVNQYSIEQNVDYVVESSETEIKIDEDLPWYQKLWGTVTEAVKNTVGTAIDSGKNALSTFVDAVTVFIIAYCAIPIFIVFFFLWMVKFLFGLNLNIKIPNRLRRKEKTEMEDLNL